MGKRAQAPLPTGILIGDVHKEVRHLPWLQINSDGAVAGTGTRDKGTARTGGGKRGLGGGGEGVENVFKDG